LIEFLQYSAHQGKYVAMICKQTLEILQEIGLNKNWELSLYDDGFYQ